jgi:hypothetical protein
MFVWYQLITSCHAHNTHTHTHMLEQGGSLLTCLNPHIKIIHLIIVIAYHQMKVGNSSPWPNNKKYGEKNERKACLLNLYPITKHGRYKSQSWIWPLWRPYFYKPCSIIFTIHLAKMLEDGLMKLCDDQSMFSHITFGIPHIIIYHGQWKL